MECVTGQHPPLKTPVNVSLVNTHLWKLLWTCHWSTPTFENSCERITSQHPPLKTPVNMSLVNTHLWKLLWTCHWSTPTFEKPCERVTGQHPPLKIPVNVSTADTHLLKLLWTCHWSTPTFENSCECIKSWHPLLKTPVNVSLVYTHLRKLLWLYSPRHAGVKGSDQAGRQAGTATLTCGLLLRKSEVLRSLRHNLQAQSQGHHTIDRMEERGVERGSARQPSLKRRRSQGRAIVNQANIATLGKLRRDRVEHIWAFLST